MMTPPTVAPVSVVVMRRHGTSHDATPKAFYVPSPLQQNNSMSARHESNGGNSKCKKSWGDRLKLGKSEKCLERPPPDTSTPDLLQEYRNKYGSLSSGSALSRSMKYAETWLYGSVAVRSPSNGPTPRPSLFLCHPPPNGAQAVIMPPGTNYAVVMCSCPEFLTGTARSKKSSSVVCKKCGGSRVLWRVNNGGGTVRASGGAVMKSGGTVRGIGGTLRLGGGSSGQNRIRPSLLNLTPVPQSTQNPQSAPQKLKAITPDPYDLVRRNRLGGVNTNEGSLHFGPLEPSRVRAKSTSPSRRNCRRSPSPTVTRGALEHASSEISTLSTQRGLSWESERANWNAVVEPSDSVKRKSILECDVNAYELIAKYLKSGNKCEANGDTNSVVVTGCGRSDRVSSDDDVLDDELSDDLSDNALENSPVRISDITGPRTQKTPVSFSSKTDVNSRHKDSNNAKQQTSNRKSRVETRQNKSISTPSMPTGVTLGGQRIRIFNETRPSPSSEEDNININSDASTAHNSENNEFDTGTSRQQISRNAAITSSLIPRLTSPRRPPRKAKNSSESSSDCSRNVDVLIQEAEEEEENESAAVVNSTETTETSLLQLKDGRSSTGAEGGCIIKSILKKPSCSVPGEISTSPRTFSDTVSKPDFAVCTAAVSSALSGQQHSPSPVDPSSGSTDFYLPTFQEYKQTHRKKKQVQFKVANDVTVLKPTEEDGHVTTTGTTTSVTNPLTTSTVITTYVSQVTEGKGDVDETDNRLLSVRTDKWTRCDKQETETEKQERRNEDTFVKQEENQLNFQKEEATISSDVREKYKAPVCDQDELKSLVNDNVKPGVAEEKEDNFSDEDVNLQYFGVGDVEVVNSGSVSSDKTASRNGAELDKDAAHDRSSPDDRPAVLGANSGSTETTSVENVLKEHSLRGGATTVSLRRCQSERLLPTNSDDLERQKPQLQAAGAAVLFNDTMRLRLQPVRPDIRQVFSDPGVPATCTSNGTLLETPKRPQRMLSPGRPRPKEPPPPPPPPSSNFSQENTEQPLPELPPRQIFPFTKKQIEQMNQQARKFSIKSNSKQKMTSSSVPKVNKSLFDSEASESSNILPVSWSPLATSTSQSICETADKAMKKKEHRHSDPGPVVPKLVVHIENSSEGQREERRLQADIILETTSSNLQEEPKQDSVNSLVKITSKRVDQTDDKVCTIVTVSAPGSPMADMHRLQIKGDYVATDVSPGPQRRTSILINSEDSSRDIKHVGFNNIGNSSVTSLMVQDDFSTSPVKKDNSNKVTISVGGVSDGLLSEVKNQNTGNTNLSSSCTVIGTSCSTLNSNMYNNNISSSTLLSSDQVNVIPVTPEKHVERTLLVVDHHDNSERSNNIVLHSRNGDFPLSVNNDNDNRVVNSAITIIESVEENVQNSSSNVILLPRSRGIDPSSTSAIVNDEDIFLNPVEAVKRNLVPHICGKKDLATGDETTNMSSSPTDRLNKLTELQNNAEDTEQETLKEGDYFMANVVSKLMDLNTSEQNPVHSNISATVSKSSEDTLPTVIEQEEEGDDDVFQACLLTETEECQKCVNSLDEEHCKMADRGLSGDSSCSNTAPISVEAENEGIANKEEDTGITSTSQLSLSLKESDPNVMEKDDQQSEVEIGDKRGSSSEPNNETDDENIYESIKDPIYEEIPDTPPPLPLSPPPSLEDLEELKRGSRSIFEGASKYDILSYLVGAKERGIVPEETYYSGSANGDEVIEIIDVKPIQDEDEGRQSHQRMTSLDLGDLSSRVSHLSNASDSSEDSCNLIISSIGEDASSPNKVRKSSAEIERNDSGVGSETSKSSRSRWQHCGPANSIREDQQHLCEDCDQPVETQVTDSGVMFAPLVCRKCGKKRAERKEIIIEIVETEEKYGRDLHIIMDEFYRPMLVAGLLTPDQLNAIFLNVEELLEHNAALAEKLRDNMEIALEQGDEDLLTVNIGKLFLEASPMLHAFESYCIRQGAASLLLANLEKEKELLRIFLRVSQMENAVLRRMNLNSFLMVPVQRVTKYPLLLARLYKVTPAHHESREILRQSQHKIELHLEHMNSEAKDISTTRLWRRISIMNGRRSSSETDMLNIKLRKMALDILEWNHDEVRFAMEGKLLYTNPADSNWKKGRTIKLNPINALLVTNGKPTEDYRPDPTDDVLMFPRRTGVREATLLLLKEKCGRYTQLREPLYLDKCIVCSEVDWEDYFEVQELISKDTFIFKAEDGERTKLWYRQLQYHAQGMGAWRRRRNALANIMINGMQTRN